MSAEPQKHRRLAPWGILIAAVSLALSLLLVTFLFADVTLPPEKQPDLVFELWSTLLDVALLTLAVGGGKWALEEFREHNKREEAKAAERAEAARVKAAKRAESEQAELEFRVGVTKTLGEIHARLYVMRRRLRIDLDDRDCFEESLHALMKARLELGDIGHHLRSQDLKGRAQVVFHMWKMREYLEAVIDEMVEACVKKTFKPGKELEGFLDLKAESADPSAYATGFKAHYLAAKKAADSAWELTEEQEKTRARAELAWARHLEETEARKRQLG